jgi:hypothetical protein
MSLLWHCVILTSLRAHSLNVSLGPPKRRADLVNKARKLADFLTGAGALAGRVDTGLDPAGRRDNEQASQASALADARH